MNIFFIFKYELYLEIFYAFDLKYILEFFIFNQYTISKFRKKYLFCSIYHNFYFKKLEIVI